MSCHDIIPDIHGQIGKLSALLDTLGYERRDGRWRHGSADRQIVFLGDFIDRGPDSGAVLETVRDLIADGCALAVMGNHELNAIHFHNDDPRTGRPLRPHSEKNRAQHAGFLDRFPVGSDGAREWVDWMAGLPLWLDLGPFRVVHACWSEGAVRRLARIAPGGVLPRERLLTAGRRGDPLHGDVETLTKGPEHRLPAGHGFTDRTGYVREHARLAWWRGGARTWREAAISVPDPDELPDRPLPDGVAFELYPRDAKPVFFGHYWLTGLPEIEAPNALCLDCSAGLDDNPLVAYRWEPGATGLIPEAIVGGGAMADGRGEIAERARVMREAWRTIGPIAVKRWAEPSAPTEFAVAEGGREDDGPVTVCRRSDAETAFPPLPDRDRQVARYRDWVAAAADGWRAD